MISDPVCIQYTDEDGKLNNKLPWVTGTVDDGRLNICDLKSMIAC
jgi:hypothetical protein